MIGKSKSLALAFSLRGELNNALGDHAFTEKSVDSYRALASTHVREATVLYGKQAAGMTPIEKEWLSLESVGGAENKQTRFLCRLQAKILWKTPMN